MNLIKGEVPLKAGDKVYRLKFTTNALCELEDLMNMAFSEIIVKALKGIPKVKDARRLLFCACIEYHRAEVTTLEEAGKIMDLATFKETWAAVVKAVAASLPDSDKDSTEKKTVSKEE